MFDIGFWELLLLGVIALLLVGPQRLPRLAYEAGRWLGRLQRILRNARSELEREFHNYEIQQTLREQEKQLKQLEESTEATRRELNEELDSLEKELKSPEHTGTPDSDSESRTDER